MLWYIDYVIKKASTVYWQCLPQTGQHCPSGVMRPAEALLQIGAAQSIVYKHGLLISYIVIILLQLTAQGSGDLQPWPHPLLQHNCPLGQSLLLLQNSVHNPLAFGGSVGHSVYIMR